jgi:hypothetical protein
MMKDVDHIEKVYARLHDRTGIPIVEVEELLAALA